HLVRDLLRPLQAEGRDVEFGTIDPRVIDAEGIPHGAAEPVVEAGDDHVAVSGLVGAVVGPDLVRGATGPAVAQDLLVRLALAPALFKVGEELVAGGAVFLLDRQQRAVLDDDPGGEKAAFDVLAAPGAFALVQ